MMTPLVILWAWGISTAGSCNPPAVGFAILFMGTAAISSWYGMKLWRMNKWRMSKITLVCITTSFVCVIAYSIAVAFIDPAVYVGNQDINFTAISIVFATLNVIPLIGLAFINDSKLRVSAKQLLIVLDASATGLGQTNKWHGFGSPFNKLLGDSYSVVGGGESMLDEDKKKGT